MTPDKPNGWYDTLGAASLGECVCACPPTGKGLTASGEIVKTSQVVVAETINGILGGEKIMPEDVKPGDLVAIWGPDDQLELGHGWRQALYIGEVGSVTELPNCLITRRQSRSGKPVYVYTGKRIALSFKPDLGFIVQRIGQLPYEGGEKPISARDIHLPRPVLSMEMARSLRTGKWITGDVYGTTPECLEEIARFCRDN